LGKLQRYFFEIAYLGTNYHGWQVQPNAITVQEVVSKSLSLILQSEISISGSGRTDTGVHCKQQYFHVDISQNINTDDLRFKLNSLLPYDISIASIQPVTDEAHARFDATSRSYEYHINRRKNPFTKELSYYFPKELDIQNMNAAAALLHGESQDYEAFSRVKTSVNNFICSIGDAHWEEKENTLIFHITANRFLRGMVRAIVGTLIDVGIGKTTPDDVTEILLSKDRRKAGGAAPAHGLYLTKVIYPKKIYIC
jgi:tRNA pseudouridine38-40 synthase